MTQEPAQELLPQFKDYRVVMAQPDGNQDHPGFLNVVNLTEQLAREKEKWEKQFQLKDISTPLNIIVDLAGAPKILTTAIIDLFLVSQEVSRIGGSLVFTNMSEASRQLVEATNLHWKPTNPTGIRTESVYSTPSRKEK